MKVGTDQYFDVKPTRHWLLQLTKQIIFRPEAIRKLISALPARCLLLTVTFSEGRRPNLKLSNDVSGRF